MGNAAATDAGGFLLPLVVVFPLAGALALLLLRRYTKVVDCLAVSVPFLTAALALGAACMRQPRLALWWSWGSTLSVGIGIEGLSAAMVVLVPTVATPILAYTVATTRGDRTRTRLLTLLLTFVAAMELLVLAEDLLTLLIAWEIVGALSWALIATQWEDTWRVTAARRAFITTRFGDLGLYLAAAAAIDATGSFAFGALANVRGPMLDVVAAGVLLAAASKSAQLPFSPWLFEAMAGPTPVSAMLHSATMVAAGAYALARLEPILVGTGWFAPAVAALGLATALAGGVVASLQTDLKKALAASTSAQYGLMLVAIGAGVPGAAGAHLVTHALFKALLFLGAGLALRAAGTLDLAELRLGTALPRAARLFLVGVLALAAVPPLGAAFSKDAILGAARAARPLLSVGVLTAGFLSAFYAFRLQLLAYGPDREAARGSIRRIEPPTGVEFLALGALAALSIALGALWIPGVRAHFAVALGGPLLPSRGVDIAWSLGSIVLAGVLIWRLWKSGALEHSLLPERVRTWAANWFGISSGARILLVEPTVALANWLARVDDVAVDTGIRAAARMASLLSAVLARLGEATFDGIVAGAARGGVRVADASAIADVRIVDATVEQLAREIGIAGNVSRRLQTGLVHQYFVILALGVLVMGLVVALGR